MPLPPMPNLLEETERRLIAGKGDISGLDRRHLKALPYILWTSPRGWSENERLVKDYLARSDRDWRTAPRRLWGHYLLNMNPGSLATDRLATWLAARADRLTPTLRDFSRKWSLFKPERGIAKVASSLLTGPDLIVEIGGLRIDRDKLLRSAFLLSVFAALGRQLQEYRQSSPISGTLKDLLADLGDTPILNMQGPSGLRQGAQKSLVEGLVNWTDKLGKEARNPTLDLLHTLIGDPRLHSPRWNKIEAGVRGTVERWLTEITLGAFFEVFRIQNAVNPKMVAEREAFWRRYVELNKVSRAWLITGSNGLSIAKRLLDKSFGYFSDGAGADHLGLMLQIGNYVILEMNQNGSTLFWSAGDKEMPGFFQPTYSRKELLRMCPFFPTETDVGRFRLCHNSAWTLRYESAIRTWTGVSHSR
ncbi:MAG TPA: EH signature domain-containing protein [Lamprocystis sp. (in: g-proteobacteria)]|nr:EH signature domain-containing protein [Lamprocystis sp. (in: g-proteobacteria)]